jgi:hypothetical protein
MPLTSDRPQLFGFFAGLTLAIGLTLATVVFARTWIHLKESQIIVVTGSAHKNVRSDLVIWASGFSAEAPTLLEAQKKLAADFTKVKAFLTAKGCKEFVEYPVRISDLTVKIKTDDTDEVMERRIGYRLIRAIEIRSDKVLRIPEISSETTELLEQGVAFMTYSLEFVYTKAGEVKVEMMADATQDAWARAEQIAAQGRRKIKELRSARMGVVQINPLYSTATSWEGNNDTTALDKTISTTVAANFSLN